MKRAAVIVILGTGFAWWFPDLAFAVGVGILIGWNVFEQPKQAYHLIEKIKLAVE